MLEIIKTVFRNGVFIPQKPTNIPEGTEVEIVVESPLKKQPSNIIPPQITDPAEKAKLMEQLIKNMNENPIPANAPRKFSREELYERD